MTIGEKIKSIRKNIPLTQEELAKKSFMSVMSIRRYENDERSPHMDALERIAIALDVKVSEFLNLDGPHYEYELIYDTLDSAGYHLEQGTGYDDYIITLKDSDDPDNLNAPNEKIDIHYIVLSNLIHKILDDSEKKKREYINKRIAAELSGWKI